MIKSSQLMFVRIKAILLFICFVLICNYAKSQDEIKGEYHFVYIALSQDDQTDFEKLINELKKLNEVLQKKNTVSILYLTKGNEQYNTDKLSEWIGIFPYINGNNLANLDAKDEVKRTLDIFKKNEFSNIFYNRLQSNRYSRIVWHVYVGSGFWKAQNNRNILGILAASCGISDSFGANFQLIISHDKNDPIVNYEKESALGKYYNFITNENTELKEY